MRRERLSEDRDVLRKKFDDACRLVAAYDDGIAQLENRLHTLYTINETVTAEDLIITLRDELIPIAKIGIGKSLIESDLDTAREGLGDAYQLWIAECWKRLTDAQQQARG